MRIRDGLSPMTRSTVVRTPFEKIGAYYRGGGAPTSGKFLCGWGQAYLHAARASTASLVRPFSLSQGHP